MPGTEKRKLEGTQISLLFLRKMTKMSVLLEFKNTFICYCVSIVNRRKAEAMKGHVPDSVRVAVGEFKAQSRPQVTFSKLDSFH